MTINPNNKLTESGSSFSELIQKLKEVGRTSSIKKAKAIITQGQKVDFVFLVERGCFRAFRWIDDEQVTIGFSFYGDMDTCPYSFINQTPSTDTIEALTDCKVIKIYRGDIEEVQRKNPELVKFIQSLLSHYIEILIQRNIDLRIKSAEELYKELLKRQPNEVAQIPLMYIASYLGITKERLSRIRKISNQLT